MELTNMMENTNDLQPILDLIDSIMGLPDENLTENMSDTIIGMVNGAFTPTLRRDSITALIEGFEAEAMTHSQAKTAIENAKDGLKDYIATLKPSEIKQKMLDRIFESLYEIFDAAVASYHGFNIELPIKLDEGATMPTYAHETDAAADLYALETVRVPAKSISNKIKTGVHLQLPEGWQARLAPRSSIGAKTPLRLSNSMGIIDTAYTGDVSVLFDNISDSDYTINAGDRIAQLWVEPIYRFKAHQVDELEETERNADGFGSTGK